MTIVELFSGCLMTVFLFVFNDINTEFLQRKINILFVTELIDEFLVSNMPHWEIRDHQPDKKILLIYINNTTVIF